MQSAARGEYSSAGLKATALVNLLTQVALTISGLTVSFSVFQTSGKRFYTTAPKPVPVCTARNVCVHLGMCVFVHACVLMTL